MRDWSEKVDAPDLGSGTERCTGSSPVSRTTFIFRELYIPYYEKTTKSKGANIMFNTLFCAFIVIVVCMLASVAYAELTNEDEEYEDYIIVNGVTYVVIDEEED